MTNNVVVSLQVTYDPEKGLDTVIFANPHGLPEILGFSLGMAAKLLDQVIMNRNQHFSECKEPDCRCHEYYQKGLVQSLTADAEGSQTMIRDVHLDKELP